MVREGDDGYRIPTPSEDDWERLRINLPTPKPGDASRIYGDVIHGFWQPQPSHKLQDTKCLRRAKPQWPPFGGRDIMVHMALAESGKEFDDRLPKCVNGARTNSPALSGWCH